MSNKPTADQLRTLIKLGVAMPDGSYYIRDAEDLSNAIKAVGRATPNAGESDIARRNAVRRHVIKRAAAINLSKEIPDTWNPDGSLKQSAMIEEFIAHFGVKGMKWGVRKSGPSGEPSSDAARAHALGARATTLGTHNLSNEELQHLVTRMNLEQQYSRLTETRGSDIGKGKAFVKSSISNVKLGLDAVDTGRRVYSQVNDATKLAKQIKK